MRSEMHVKHPHNSSNCILILNSLKLNVTYLSHFFLGSRTIVLEKKTLVTGFICFNRNDIVKEEIWKKNIICLKHEDILIKAKILRSYIFILSLRYIQVG